MIKVKQTDDKELLADILKQLKENDNYCPCSLYKTIDTKCMCKAFREQIAREEPGECVCGRYVIEVIEN